jgi:hypothetical protein
MSNGQPDETRASRRTFIAGGPDDPRHGMARCLTCRTKIIHYQEETRLWIDDGGHWHTGHEIELFPEISPEPETKRESAEESTGSPPRVVLRITDVGCYYRTGQTELGPYTVEDEEDPNFDVELAKGLGVEPKEILLARQRDVVRPTTFDEIGEVLGSTIRHDLPTKLILFSAGILTFTDEDQINILMSGESAGGKSYNALEVARYFPQENILHIATASPTAFFHDTGIWDKETKVVRVNLRQKLLIFLDQPHFTLMERLRPLLSHDKRGLLYKITDKSKGGALRTKNVLLEGFPTVVFCAAKFSLDDQERTRVFILSPETGSEKLEESLRLTTARVADREGFKQWIESNPRRRWLKARVAAIRDAKVNQVIVQDQEGVYQRFRESHSRLAPRHQRDLPRILSLIKAHALLNYPNRESLQPRTIVANQQDVDAGFWLYNLIAKPNELGLSPQVYEIYESVIKPLLVANDGVDRKRVLASYHERYGRSLSEERLRRDILPALEASGLVAQEPDPADKRRMRVVSPVTPPISPNVGHEQNRGSNRGYSSSERIQAGIAWLRQAENLDVDGCAPLGKFTEVVGGPETVRLMLKDGLIELHPTALNKVRLRRP